MSCSLNHGSILLLTIVALVLTGCSKDHIVSPELASSERVSETDTQVALAKTGKKKAFGATQVITGGSPPQSTWTGNVRHDRGAIALGSLTGDIVGTVKAIGNGVFVQKDETHVKGTIQLEATFTVTELFGKPVNGGFEAYGVGQVDISPDGETNTGRFNGHGTGDLKGMRVHGTWELVDERFLLEGFILMP